MILSELVRRGRGERVLVVTPRHVLEQMQQELWTRFALPFVRLDSVGIQRIRQQIPGNRNPFAFYKRAIISIDTLKSDRYLSHLRKQHWDAVVIDESHNVTGRSQNNRLARLLASRTDSLPTTVAYKRRLAVYRGELAPARIFAISDTSDVSIATLAYGVGNWYLVRGDTTRARHWFGRAIASGGWPAFGFMAAEADLRRLDR